MTFILPPLPFPLGVADERRAINRLAVDVAVVRHKFNKEFGLPRLEELLLDGLREGQLTLAVKASEAADNGDPIADRALRPSDMTEDGSIVLHDGLRFSFKDGMSPEFLASVVNADFLFDCMNALMSTIDVGHQRGKELAAEARKEVSRVELENIRLKSALESLTAKVESLAFISERLRIENAGPPGPQGLMGRDGRDGVGQIGPRGERGPPGPSTVAWKVDEQAFTVTPLNSDGKAGGAVLHLLPLFQSYTEQMEASADEEAYEAAQAQRAVIEREAENRRVGLPAR
jgi:hypothetical protein